MKIHEYNNKHLKEQGLKNLPTEFPDSLLDDEWAMRVHSQTLAKLNDRGGLSIGEIYMNLLKLRDCPIIGQKQVDFINNLIETHETKETK